MTAYPGTNAQFPTVKGVASPYGPRHTNPLPLAGWLGPSISGENEADTGPDVDLTNNLIPNTDTADQDTADDGLALPIPISHCVASSLQFSVAIPESAPSGVDWQVNAWFDWNRNGAWGDVLSCGGEPAPEWAVQNLGLGELEPGYHIFEAALLPHNAAPSDPMWMRLTLSDEPASSADGSGLNTDYAYGETEDYYLTSSDLQPWSSTPITPGGTFERAFPRMGNYPFTDHQQPDVQGTIRVRPGSTTQLQRLAETGVISITDTGFVPVLTRIAVSDTVRWHNETSAPRTVVGDVLVIDIGQHRSYLPLVLRSF